MRKTPNRGQTKKQTPRTIIIGVGNLLLKDEGIGIHVANALQQMKLPENVRVIDGGTSPDLVAYIEAGDKLIIVDAAKAGGKPGTIYRILPEDLATDSSTFSVHDIGIAEGLKMMALAGSEPGEVVIIGVEPKEIDWGTELSPELRQKVDRVLEIVLKEIGRTEPEARASGIIDS